jgi:hypothetical protein
MWEMVRSEAFSWGWLCGIIVWELLDVAKKYLK